METGYSKWRKLDNAALAFPLVTGKNDSRVFRFYCQLKEEVDPDILQKALDQTMEKYPLFQAVLRKGLFWFYLERRDIRAVVKPEKKPPCSQLYIPDQKSLLFRVSYHRNRINFEVYHALTDGTGAMNFVTELVQDYLILAHPEDKLPWIELADEATPGEQEEDSFSQYYSSKIPKNKEKKPPAVQLKGEKLIHSDMQITEVIFSVKEILAKAEKLYKMRPLSRAYWYALWNFAYISVSTETEPENFLTTIKAFEDKVANEFKINSEEQKTSLLYNIEKQYILYYSKNGNKPEERKHVEQAYQYAEKLNQLNPARFVLEIISAQASYIDMLLELSEHDKALKAAIDLEALYTMQGVWGFQDLRTENSIGTAMVCGGLYELGVEHLEKVKKDREKHLKQKPNDVDMMGSITTTYNNLSLGYGKLKKYAKALEVQKKAYEIIKTLYPHNKAQLGTNYLLMTLNTSIAYYQNSNNAEALKFLQEAENIANELKELNQLFSSYPLVVRFAKGDLLAKLSQPGSEELLKTGLEYKSGTLPNDAVLLYLINDYRINNNSIYRK